MKEFLGGMMGMSKGVGIEDIDSVIKNNLAVVEKNLVQSEEKGNNYIVATVDDKLNKLIVPMVHVIKQNTEDVATIKNMVVDLPRMIETMIIEYVTKNQDVVSSEQNQIPIDYEDMAKLAGLSNGTDIKYYFLDLGLLWRKQNGRKFYVVEGALQNPNTSQEIRDMCVIGKNRKTKDKDEYYFDPIKGLEYFSKNKEKITDAKNMHEKYTENLNKVCSKIDEVYIECQINKDQKMKTAQSECETMDFSCADKIMRFISAVAGDYNKSQENKQNWYTIYDYLDKNHKSIPRNWKQLANGKSKGRFLIIDMKLGKEMFMSACECFQDKARTVLLNDGLFDDEYINLFD